MFAARCCYGKQIIVIDVRELVGSLVSVLDLFCFFPMCVAYCHSLVVIV